MCAVSLRLCAGSRGAARPGMWRRPGTGCAPTTPTATTPPQSWSHTMDTNHTARKGSRGVEAEGASRASLANRDVLGPRLRRRRLARVRYTAAGRAGARARHYLLHAQRQTQSASRRACVRVNTPSTGFDEWMRNIPAAYKHIKGGCQRVDHESPWSQPACATLRGCPTP